MLTPENTTRRRLPKDVHYSRREGGMWVSWNGRPDGAVWVTYCKEVAHGADYGPNGETWLPTGYQGADGSCRLGRILRLVATAGPYAT